MSYTSQYPKNLWFYAQRFHQKVVIQTQAPKEFKNKFQCTLENME